MKKLTQADFEHAPIWVKSATVDENGHGFYHNIEKSKLKNDGGQWSPSDHRDCGYYIIAAMTGDKKAGSIVDIVEFDATDWQNSAIDRA